MNLIYFLHFKFENSFDYFKNDRDLSKILYKASKKSIDS